MNPRHIIHTSLLAAWLLPRAAQPTVHNLQANLCLQSRAVSLARSRLGIWRSPIAGRLPIFASWPGVLSWRRCSRAVNLA